MEVFQCLKQEWTLLKGTPAAGSPMVRMLRVRILQEDGPLPPKIILQVHAMFRIDGLYLLLHVALAESRSREEV